MQVVGQAGGLVRCVPDKHDGDVQVGDYLYSNPLGAFEIMLLEEYRDGSYLIGIMSEQKPSDCITPLDAFVLRSWPVTRRKNTSQQEAHDGN